MKYVWATLFIGLFTGGWADFYQTTFTAAQSEWQYNFLYSLQMGVHNEGNTYAVAYNPLRITGDGLTAAYYNELYGFYLRKTNVLYNASPENPIGYEITRTYINIDPDEGINPESGRMRTAFQLLWVQHDPSVSAGGSFFPILFTFQSSVDHSWGPMMDSPVSQMFFLVHFGRQTLPIRGIVASLWLRSPLQMGVVATIFRVSFTGGMTMDGG